KSAENLELSDCIKATQKDQSGSFFLPLQNLRIPKQDTVRNNPPNENHHLFANRIIFYNHTTPCLTIIYTY
ncbi:MAG TPA: hypothetical protein PK198_11940, partial [Saprospiraceae bacterium]|nr:hypothetical protein [Saprospiraceae bacterium]